MTQFSKRLQDLKHTTEKFKNGGYVLVLNTGGVITPESEAMLQALHSRSIGGIRAHLEALAKRGSSNFMRIFYVGYNHKSIGDCGSTTIFIEGVSMLAAKVIQDWALYSGQESSTRYISFDTQLFMNPRNVVLGEQINEAWRSFYITSMPVVVTSLQHRFPRDKEEKETQYNKAINARAFDILRGFLPAGATTNLAWHTNLRQAADKLELLRNHILPEVRNIAAALQRALQRAHPSSFGHKMYPSSEMYYASCMRDDYYFDRSVTRFALVRNDINPSLINWELVKSRPNHHCELPKYVAEGGTIQFTFPLDFGSFRDIQRHRAVTQRMPLLTTELGFHSWYLDELPDELRCSAEHLLEKQMANIRRLGVSPEMAQYYTAMGFLTSNRVTGSLPALVYLVELRASSLVHPTLRKVAVQMAAVLKREFGPYGLTLHLDEKPDRFNIKRGAQDIVLK